MEDNNNTRARLEELGLSTEQIDEVTQLMAKKAQPEESDVPSGIDELKEQLKSETDYIKRASLAAKIISLSLDEGY